MLQENTVDSLSLLSRNFMSKNQENRSFLDIQIDSYHNQNQNSLIRKQQMPNELSQFQYSRTINPYFDRVKNRDINDESQSLTDRYIPCRKYLNKLSLESKTIDSQLIGVPRNLEHAQSVSDLYRKILLTCKSQQEQKIKIFENRNKLQFKTQNQKNINSIINENNCQLGFTQEVQNIVSVKRRISKMPIKILDAPTLQDDYYLNLIDWSSKNLLSVGLSSCVYLWNSANSKVTKLCQQDPSQSITSVSWSRDGSFLGVGSTNGTVEVWDPVKVVKIRCYGGHHARVGAISWSSNVFSTGSRDKSILNRDIRSPNDYHSKWINHKQEVCGLRWSSDGQQLSSGGNDNRLLVWSVSSLHPLWKFDDHKAAVKALAWSPHQHGLLVSGGGTADRTIRFRDTLTGTTVDTVEAGSQVCNLMFSKTLNELVSTHGYSHNQINIWKCPKMDKITTLTGHSMRVLYLSMSPDGSTIVTGAGDETLRFWNVFPSNNESYTKLPSKVDLNTIVLR